MRNTEKQQRKLKKSVRKTEDNQRKTHRVAQGADARSKKTQCEVKALAKSRRADANRLTGVENIVLEDRSELRCAYALWKKTAARMDAADSAREKNAWRN